MDVVLDLLYEAKCLHVGDDALARHEAVETAIGLRNGIVEVRIGVEHVDELELVPAPDLKIIEIVTWRDLDRAATGRGIGVLIRHDRNPAVDQWQGRLLAPAGPVA